MNELIKVKKPRQRLNPTHRWTTHETKSLLTTILDELKNKPGSFEQPTAAEFYMKISAKAKGLKGIDVYVYRSKMRNLKTNYIKALWMLRKKQHDPQVKETVKNICPFWNLLHEIFRLTSKGKLQQETISFEPDKIPAPDISSTAEDPAPDISSTAEDPAPDISYTANDLSNFFIEIPKKLKVPIKILGRPRNSRKNIAALSNLLEMHENKLQFEACKWQKQLKYNEQKLLLERDKFELRLMELQEDFDTKKEEMLMQESEALEQLKLRVTLLESLRIEELALKSTANCQDN